MTWMNTNESIAVYIPALCRSAIEAIVTTYGATLHIIDNVTHDNFICNRFIGTIKITSRHHIARIYCATSCAKCFKKKGELFLSLSINTQNSKKKNSQVMTLFSKLETCSRCSPCACSIVRQVLSDIIYANLHFQSCEDAEDCVESWQQICESSRIR